MSWIWLDEKAYPEFQKNISSIMQSDEVKSDGNINYCVADFYKKFDFNKKIEKIKIRVSADSSYILYLNNELIGIGPASSGGDFLCIERAPKHYADNYELNLNSEGCPSGLDITAKVRLQPEMLTDYSRGHGGFYLLGTVFFTDGSCEKIETDSSWQAFSDMSYKGFRTFKLRSKPDLLVCGACEIDDIWDLEDSHIPPRSLNKIFSTSVQVGVGEKSCFKFELDKIYGVHPELRSSGMCEISLKTSELEGQKTTDESIIFDSHGGEYISFRMHSAGFATLTVENTDSIDIQIDFSLIAPWYPVTAEGCFETDNADLNKIYDVCKHTLKICRQSLHLDSTKHQELLACTGDYYIESLMTLFCFGDMRLAEFDLMRTADWLYANNGVMFHTTYSLIWVQMLHDVYMITGRKELLLYCRKGLDALLAKFESYIVENEIIDNPPDFMFVDWTVIDGFSMHHPPKALGQTVLNCFYYKSLIEAEKNLFIYRRKLCCRKAERKSGSFQGAV